MLYHITITITITIAITITITVTITITITVTVTITITITITIKMQDTNKSGLRLARPAFHAGQAGAAGLLRGGRHLLRP